VINKAQICTAPKNCIVSFLYNVHDWAVYLLGCYTSCKSKGTLVVI
jgi:hypothetical protein